MTYTYSFDLSDYEGGRFVATRYSGLVAVSGDWVCQAESDEEAVELARKAAYEEWAAPETRPHLAFEVAIVSAQRGRPAAPGSLTEPLQLRVSRDALARYQAAAAAAGLTLADWVRATLDGATK